MIDYAINYIKKEDKFVLFIYLYFFLMPWNFFKGQMGALTVILFIWWIFKYKKSIVNKIKEVFLFKPFILLFLFIIYCYITALWSDSIIAGLKYINSFNKYYFLFTPVLFTTLSKEEAINSIKIIVISFLSYSIFSILIYMGLFTIESTHSNMFNPKGIMGYAISTQYMAIGSISCFVFALFSKSRKYKIIFFLGSLLCFFSLFVNNSRTSQLSFILTIFSMFLIYFKNSIFKIKNMTILISTFLLIAILGYIFLEKTNKINRYEVIGKDVSRVVEKGIYDGSIGTRIFFYKAGIETFIKNPFFGTGPLDNWEINKKMQKENPNYVYPEYIGSFHSQHINILTAFGLVGYLLLFFSVFYLIYKLKGNKQFFYVALSFYLPFFYISLANATIFKKPINYIFVSIFVLFGVIIYKELINKKNDNFK